MDSIKNLLKFTPPKPTKTTEWQLLALEAIDYFIDGKQKRSSIFKCFKDDMSRAKICLLDCKELERRQTAYFFKIYYILTSNYAKT